MEEISEASLYINGKFITELDYPKLKNVDGEILIDCYLINKNHGYENDSIYYKEIQQQLSVNQLEVKGISKRGSQIVFNSIYLKSSSYPTFEFTFICFNDHTEYIFCDENSRIENFSLNALILEGLEVQFTNTSKTMRERYMFGVDDSATLSLKLDNHEVNFQFFTKKRQYDFKIGIIENQENENSLVIKFFGDNLLPYRVYYLLKDSLKYFLSYIAGNNVIIREESFTINDTCYISKTYSAQNIAKFNKNQFLPVFDVQFRHKNMLQYYLNTLPNYLFLDKSLNLSEVIYLVNQSKQVNLESSFFILLIAIEKLSNNLIKSNLATSTNNFIIDNEIFQDLKPILLKKVDEVFKNRITNKEIDAFKTKIGNLNIKNKTDNKIDILLDFCGISRNAEIDLLFPKLRNLAIHEGEISFSENDASKNYHTLFILINSIICNLIQYKGIRFIEHKNKTNYISKKETFVMDYKIYS